MTVERVVGAGAGATILVMMAACAVNPATGKRQISLIGEAREIEMGREADEEIVRSLGLYDDPDMQAYVQALGKGLAAESERPDLPWTFRVLDDPVVNAFALPGGFIYVTRGIMTHLGSEAELVSVLGHEIGHVTARHGVNQLSKAKLATLGLGIGMIVSEDLREFEEVAGLGLGLLFLKYGRDDETQADGLGLRYMTRTSYDPDAMPEVFGVLRDVSRVQGTGRLPNWLSTHPAPDDRIASTRRRIERLEPGVRGGRIGRDDYLARLDGMVFGENPREGFFRDSLFLHPDMKFRIEFPKGWKPRNMKQSVSATSPDQDAAVQLTLASESSPAGAADRFFRQEGVSRGSSWIGSIHGLPTVSASFAATSGQDRVRGAVAFVEYGGRVYRLLGYTRADLWSRYEDDLEGALASFDRLTDPAALNVEPRRLRLVRIDRQMSVEDFERLHPSAATPDEVRLINRVGAGELLPVGSLVKRVVGGPR